MTKWCMPVVKPWSGTNPCTWSTCGNSHPPMLKQQCNSRTWLGFGFGFGFGFGLGLEAPSNLLYVVHAECARHDGVELARRLYLISLQSGDHRPKELVQAVECAAHTSTMHQVLRRKIRCCTHKVRTCVTLHAVELCMQTYCPFGMKKIEASRITWGGNID